MTAEALARLARQVDEAAAYIAVEWGPQRSDRLYAAAEDLRMVARAEGAELAGVAR